jgi:formate hydrogenlyase subunit 6/NADH:ubiquinone oxidoreductase subunit I
MDRVLLRFSAAQIPQPITAKVILDLGIPLNILNANVTPQGGEVLLEVSESEVSSVVRAFKAEGVDVIVQPHILVDLETCIHCGACYSLCPVDVISFTDDLSIDFATDRCVLCGLCVDTCPVHAISL